MLNQNAFYFLAGQAEEVKCPSLWEFWVLLSFSLERVLEEVERCIGRGLEECEALGEGGEEGMQSDRCWGRRLFVRACLSCVFTRVVYV